MQKIQKHSSDLYCSNTRNPWRNVRSTFTAHPLTGTPLPNLGLRLGLRMLYSLIPENPGVSEVL